MVSCKKKLVLEEVVVRPMIKVVGMEFILFF